MKMRKSGFKGYSSFALVTGAASGMGRVYALHLAAMGYSLMLVDINGDGLIDAKDFSNGWMFNMEDDSMFFPAAARFDGSYAMLMGSVCGMWGSYWSNAPGAADYGYGGMGFCALSFQSTMVTPNASASRADAYSVRCVRE